MSCNSHILVYHNCCRSTQF